MQNPAEIKNIARPEPAINQALARIGTATVSSELSRLGCATRTSAARCRSGPGAAPPARR